MATSGTPHEGTDNIILDAYTGLQMILYTNTGNSLDRDTVLADLTEPSALDDSAGANGYGAVTLSGVWSSASSIIAYDHGTPNEVVYTNTGSLGNWDTVVGSAITDGTYILHFMDLDTPVSLAIAASIKIDVSSVVS